MNFKEYETIMQEYNNLQAARRKEAAEIDRLLREVSLTERRLILRSLGGR